MRLAHHLSWLVIACLGSALTVDVKAQSDSDSVVVAIAADPGHFNPGITTGYNVHVVADSMFNGLVALDSKLTPTPDLAESWTVSDDNKVYT
ncbi:MAG: hypothetical protein ACR2RF_33755, partial [Geminicoccaceae bacterium]